MHQAGGRSLLRVTMAAIALLLLVKTADLVEVAAASVPQAVAASAPPKVRAVAARASTTPLAEAHACPPSVPPAELSLLADLKARKVSLDGRQSALTARERALSAAEKQVSARMAELTALQKKIENETEARKDAASAQTMRLVAMYEAMKPADAAAIFNDLDRGVLLAVLRRMNVRRAAAIMAAMAPQRARLVTAELAAAGAATPGGPGG